MWQPIDSAPKDGTHILGWNGLEMTTIYWVSFVNRMTRNGVPLGGYWALAAPGLGGEDDSWEPTHWTLLPESPVESPDLNWHVYKQED